MTSEPSKSASDGIRVSWRTVAQALTRPYRVTIPMILLVSLVPCYVLIAEHVRNGPVHAPELALDSLFPLTPTWALVYGALYAFLIVLPVIVIQQEELIRRTVWAYLLVWIVSFACFLLYPTVAPRPDVVVGDGFAVWGIRSLYAADAPYNCFPSLHVAHSFVSALAAYRVNRTLGLAAISCASLVAVSTLFTKQHWVVDAIAGIFLALVAYAIFLRDYSRAKIPERDRRIAPFLALCVGGIVGLGFACSWLVYALWSWL